MCSSCAGHNAACTHVYLSTPRPNICQQCPVRNTHKAPSSQPVTPNLDEERRATPQPRLPHVPSSSTFPQPSSRLHPLPDMIFRLMRRVFCRGMSIPRARQCFVRASGASIRKSERAGNCSALPAPSQKPSAPYHLPSTALHLTSLHRPPHTLPHPYDWSTIVCALTYAPPQPPPHKPQSSSSPPQN